MKKISLLKSFGLIAASTAAVSPVVLTVGCSSTGVVSAQISWKTIVNDKKLDNINTGRYNYDDMLLGSKKFFNGNYILFVGSNMIDSTCNFFSGLKSVRDVNRWLADDFQTSIFYKDSMLVDQNKQYFDFGFVSFIDNFDNQFKTKDGKKLIITKNDSIFGTWPVKPFDTWTKEIISTTKAFMKENFDYDWNADEDNPEVKEGDFIRQDDQARTYRDFINRGALLFPTSDDRKQGFDNANDNQTTLMVIYKDGKLQDIVTLPNEECTEANKDNKDTNSLTTTINKFFLDEEEEDDDK